METGVSEGPEMPGPAGGAAASGRGVVLAATAVVLVLASTEAAQVYLGLSLLGGGVPWSLAVRTTAPSWLVLLVLVLPLLAWLEARPWHDRPSPVVHVPLAVAFTVLHLAGSAWLFERVVPEPIGFVDHVYQLATVYFVLDLLTYAAVVGVHGLDRRRREDRRREVEAARLLADAAEARVEVLRGQLRPDFFFNALNGVTGLILRGDAERGADALAALGELIRRCLSVTPGGASTLADEMGRVRRYLTVQELRFADRMRVRVAVDRGVERRTVSALTVLHVVEALVDGGLADGRPFDLEVTAVDHVGGVAVRAVRNGPPVVPADLAASERRLARAAVPGRLRLDPAGRGAILEWTEDRSAVPECPP